MNKDTIQLKAEGEFPFTFYIEKAIASEENEDMIITGVASTINIDHDGERMSESALLSMAEIINEKSVPLRVEHQTGDNAVVGDVFKAWVDERSQLWIKALLHKDHPASGILYKSLKDGIKLGLSVGGKVKSAIREFSEATGKIVKTFYQVALDEVSVTQRPANYDSWLLAKSIIKDKNENTDKFYNSQFYKSFLFENISLDYMQTIAKSIPDKSWKRVELLESNINKDMTKEKETKETEEETKTKAASETTETETKEKAEATETETKEKKESTDTTETEKSFKDFVVKGMEALAKAIESLSKKSEEGTTIMEDSSTKEKAEDTETETKTKAEATETETKKKEKAESETTEETPATEKSMKNLLARIDTLTKAMTKKEDSKDESEESETKKSTIDTFVEQVTKSIETLEANFAKSGKSVPGMRESILNSIKNDKEMQNEIADMLKQPGFKKSVSKGIPYMTSREGQVYRLTPVAEKDEKITKSTDGKAMSFKDLYKTQFSSSAEKAE